MDSSLKLSSGLYDEMHQTGEELKTPASLVGKYQYIRKLGQGSQAKVYQAVRIKDHQRVCIKQLDIESVSNWKEYELFQREAAVLSSLDINGVASFYEAIEDLNGARPCAFIVQEFIEGEALADMLKAGHRFDVKEVYDILIQLLRIIYQLQNRPNPVIHRDIKPSNIMITPGNGTNIVTLIDFGAVANPQVQSGGSTTAGTFGYMPPEQCMCHTCPASDIYSLGAVAVELFSGVTPSSLPVKDFRLIFEPELKNQPDALVNVLRRMLDPDYKNRFSNPVKLIEIFKQFQNGDFKCDEEKQPEPLKYEIKLTEVNEIGAPGNIELWQTLSNETPRQIPKVYKEANWTPNSELSDIIPNNLNHYLLKGSLYIISFLVLSILFIILSTIISNRFYALYHNHRLYLPFVDENTHGGWFPTAFAFIGTIGLFVRKVQLIHRIKHPLKAFVYTMGFLLSLVLFLIFLLVAIEFLRIAFNVFGTLVVMVFGFIGGGALFLHSLKFWRSFANRINERWTEHRQHKTILDGIRANHKSSDNSYHKIPKSLSDLLKNGRKTIATIVEVDYLPVKHWVKKGELDATPDRPQFLVKYKLNLPNANSESDVIHKITVFTEPGRNYRVGDPLPILYKVYDQDTIEETVRSMVFPVPLDDVCEECISCSTMTYYDQYEQLLKRYKIDAPAGGLSQIEAIIDNRNDIVKLGEIIHGLICNPFPVLLNNPFNICDYLLELLSIFIKIKGYKEIHADCIRLMFICFEQSSRLTSRMYNCIMEYLNNMCEVGNMVAPDAFEVLCEPCYIDMMERLDGRLIAEILRISRQSSGLPDSLIEQCIFADEQQAAASEQQCVSD